MPSLKHASTDLGLVGIRAAEPTLLGSALAPAASHVSGEGHQVRRKSSMKVATGAIGKTMQRMGSAKDGGLHV
jgi:hypothetical protein